MIRKIPQETPYFHFHNANPKGRRTTDCVIRALCTALEIPYNQVVMELAELQCKTGFDDGDDKLYSKYLEAKGWEQHKQPRKADNTKYTGVEWCHKLQQEAYTPRMLAHIGGHHITAIIDGEVWDTWNSTRGCIGKYWTKK